MKLSVRVGVVFVIVSAVAVLGIVLSMGPKVKAQSDIPDRFAKFATPDDVTDAIRSRESSLYRVSTGDFGKRAAAAGLGRIVEDYGSFVIVASRSAKLAGPDVQQLETTVNLPNARFDPLEDDRFETVKPGDRSVSEIPGGGYFIVQFAATVTDEWLESIEDAGGEVLQYLPHQSFFVYAENSAIVRIAEHSRVRWVGRYLPGDKLAPEVRNFAANAVNGRATFDVAVFKRANLESVAGTIENGGAKIVNSIKLPSNFFNVLRIEAPVDSLDSLAAIPDVIRIDQYERPRIEDERAAQIVAGNYSSTTVISAPGYNPLAQFGVNGSNVTVSVVDDGVNVPGNGGFYLTSGNTVNGPLRGAASGATGGHGHINASIIAGSTPFGALDPTGYNYGLGVSPNANILNIPLLVSGYTGTELDTYNDTVTTAGPNGIFGSISNNSWGNGTNGNVYDSYTAQFDGFVQDTSTGASIDPITLVFSAGNSGPGTLSLTRPKASKNSIVVGNSENIRTELGSTGADNMDDLRSSSSRGPTSDGRVKPDIVAPGTVITGSRAGTCGSVSSCFDANHAYSTGTSHAAPQVAGAAALFTQFWKNNNSGVNPSPALIKASVINTGQEMNGATTNTATVPNGNEGWGRINLKNMFDSTVPIKRVNQTVNFSNAGETVVYAGTVASASKPVRISLVWTDPPAATTPALINNLDLTVQIGASTYRGNVFSGGNSTTGGANSTIDNVENVFLPAGIPAGTAVTITVSAAALNGNGILGNADATDQNFALVAYNFSEVAVNRPAPVDFDGDDKTDISIFRPSVGEWWYLRSVDGGNRAFQFGTSNDKLVPGDFTGDGKTDVAFWRPSNANWYVLRSENSTFYSFPFGAANDVPLPYDFDGDGKADAGIFRPSNATWYVSKSSGGTTIQQFGLSTDIPAVADYDGDGKADIAIYRSGLGQWWIQRSGDNSVFAFTFGSANDKIVQGDYTGDGKADGAFFRPSDGTWYVLRSEDFTFFSAPFGLSTDVPSPGDYDGDGKFDFAVFRPGNSTWYIQRSTAGIQIAGFGANGDVSVPSAFVP
ncbi:MAG: S8 family serine peptidase [Acidobacteria bacterium]|nr:S8 family serine peptidase [Acidobacteriota bacterium]